MYFKEKEDTNIDKEFKKDKKRGFELDFSNIEPKKILFIVGGVILLIIIIIIALSALGGSSKYTLELFGNQTVVINVGDVYIEPGYIALDNKQNDVSDKVKITSNLDRTKAGEYEISYEIDGSSKVRYIKVIEGNQSTYIYLLGEQTMYLKVGQKYNEPGYSAYDKIDKDLEVTVTGTVDTSKKGTYKLIYTVTNSQNVTVNATRYIVVE